MIQFDRLYDWGDLLCETNGHGAIFSPMPGKRPEGMKPTTPKMLESKPRYLEQLSSLASVDARTLLSAVRWPDCASCQNHRDKQCRYCHGDGKITRVCDCCDHTHVCDCIDCDSGRVDCNDCNTMAPLLVSGETFDLRLVRHVVDGLGLGPESELSYGVFGTEKASGNIGWHLLLRSGDRFAIVMGAMFDTEDDRISWP